MKLSYKLATDTWDNDELTAMQKVIDSKFFTMGQKVKNFEELFAEKFGSKYAVMVNSGSSANLLMIAALRYSSRYNLMPGDEVIVPAVSWSTSYYPLYQYGLKIKFVDIDINTLNYDIEKLKSAVSDKTKCILCVNLLGNPNNFSEILKLIQSRNIILLEDNCESMGAVYKQKYAGTFGLMGSFSTFFSHHISTMEGGMVVTDDEELFHIMLCLRAHGWTRNLPEVNHVTGKKDSDAFSESFKFALPGYNLRPLELSGAIGIVQLEKLDSFVNERRKNAFDFISIMKDCENVIVQTEIGQSSWFGFSLILKEKLEGKRKDIVKIFDNAGIECRPIVAGNFAKNSVVKYFDYEISSELNNAEYIDVNGLFIGNHHYRVEGVFDKIRDMLEGATC